MLSDQPSGDLADDLADDLAATRADLALARRQQETLAEELATTQRDLVGLREQARALGVVIDEQLTSRGLAERVQRKVRGALGRDDAEAAQVGLIRASDLFDGPWYLLQHPEVVETSLDPVRHYLRHGAALGWDPSPGFSTRRFLEQEPDVAAAGDNPLVVHLRRTRRGGPKRTGRA